MTILHLILLSLVQGITEFLPISSSGHLILLPIVTGMEDQGLLMDVSVHVGTLAAVLLYFREDTKGLTLAALGAIGIAPARRAIEGTQYAKLFWALVLATIPTVIIGGIFAVSGIEEALRSASVIAATSILFGILLYWADKRGGTHLDMAAMKLKPALIIGFAQVLALIPGTSRAGITMTAARYLGFNRVDAARFSMLLSIPTILAAGTLGALKLVSDGNPLALTDAAIGAGLSCLAALVAIHFLMRWLTHATMTIFVAYRVGLGLALFAMIGAGWL
ncbi:undecaprenyl-diphosphate phosphatase [Gimibacter soli]|uniref:Undecaprenyl-diphosphatase n=1 Tax=Gimibacter soli TaxID=3024400 RepID=A0AAE9XQG2_9PROT|nr:undecaprenyl-diphosphate phosphatase [Gimibacter soli]WCL54491.1 undecaprenyl-diphosphate phosphatase [Gimibacter soli]